MNQEEMMQQLQAAVQAYQRKDLDGAEVVFKQILAVNPKEPNALHLLGCINKDRGNLQQAIDLIQASIREDDSNPIPFLNLGKILSIAGQHENAAGVFQESLKRNQQIPEAWFCFGNALREMGKTQEAIQAYRNTLQRNHAHAGAAGNLGALLTEEEKLDEAEEVLRKALEIAPENANCLVNLGHVLKDEGEVEEAIASYRKAIAEKPDFADAYLSLGLVLKEEGEVEEAIASYRKAIEVKPDFAEAYLNLGNVLKEEGEVEEAIASYRKAIEVKPDFVIALSGLAQCLMDSGRVLESLDFFKKCLQLNSWDPRFCEGPARSCDSYWVASSDERLRGLAVSQYEKSFQVRPLISCFTFASNSSNSGSPAASSLIQSLPVNAELLPSYKALISDSFLSLYYLHIPKNGGIRFTVPLQECIRLFENSLFDGKFDSWKGVIDFQHSYSRLTSLRLNNQSLHYAFLNSLSSSDPDQDINLSLIMSHGSWSSLKLQKRIADVTGQMPIRVGAWRDPRKRFLSALHYLYREAGGSVERVAKDLSDKISFLHNAIYRYVADCIEVELSESNRESAVDYLLELGDHSLLNQLQSSFLSRNRLPNLIVSKRFNVTKEDFRMSEEEEDRLLSEFSIDEFVRLDESEFVNSLRVSQLPSDLCCEPVCEELHPLTVVVSDSTKQSSSGYKSEICLTSDLVGERGRQKLHAIFSGKNT